MHGRLWHALKVATRVVSLVVFHKGRCIAHAGYATWDHVPGTAVAGPICKSAIDTGKGNYLPNLKLYPGEIYSSSYADPCAEYFKWLPACKLNCVGRIEFLEYLPTNVQGILLQPIGTQGVLVAATDTIRGFTRLDQVSSTQICARNSKYKKSFVLIYIFLLINVSDTLYSSYNSNPTLSAVVLQAWLSTIADKLDNTLEEHESTP